MTLMSKLGGVPRLLIYIIITLREENNFPSEPPPLFAALSFTFIEISALLLSLSVAGLSAPVPRGRKGKKLKNQLNIPDVKNADWLAHCNPEVVLQDESYKKHLKQHCNKSVNHQTNFH